MGGSSDSKTEQVQTQQQITDSYNTTYDQVLNLADVGNVKINFPDAGQSSGSGISPTMLVAGFGLIAAVMILRK